MTDETPDTTPAEPVPEPASPEAPGRPAGRLVRTGAILLTILGALYLFGGVSAAADPERARCSEARIILEDEEEVDDGSDVECDEALERAAALDAADEDDEVDTLHTESYIRTFGLILGGIGLLQAVGGVLTLRLRTKAARLVALIGCALGIVFSPLGLLAILPIGFVVYALMFSVDARAVFGDPGGPRMFRPRP